jgi:hypothetical protein
LRLQSLKRVVEGLVGVTDNTSLGLPSFNVDFKRLRGYFDGV